MREVSGQGSVQIVSGSLGFAIPESWLVSLVAGAWRKSMKTLGEHASVHTERSQSLILSNQNLAILWPQADFIEPMKLA